MYSHSLNKVRCILLFFTIALVTLCSWKCYGQTFSWQGNTVTYRGNTFEMKFFPNDTVAEVDASTGDERLKVIAHDPVPAKMNGEKIYQPDELTSTPAPYLKGEQFELQLLKRLSAYWKKLPDGNYHLDVNNIVVNQKGKIVFYSYSGCYGYSPIDNNTSIGVPADIKKAMKANIDSLMIKATMIPGKLYGKPVLSRSPIYLYSYTVKVTAHKATITKNK